MDWHSSGITTSVIGALKRGLTPLGKELMTGPLLGATCNLQPRCRAVCFRQVAMLICPLTWGEKPATQTLRERGPFPDRPLLGAEHRLAAANRGLISTAAAKLPSDGVDNSDTVEGEPHLFRPNHVRRSVCDSLRPTTKSGGMVSRRRSVGSIRDTDRLRDDPRLQNPNLLPRDKPF